MAYYEPKDGGAHNVWVAGDTLYLGDYQGGLRVVDISGELRGDLLRQGREIAHVATAFLAALVWQETRAVPLAVWVTLVGCWLLAIVGVSRLSALSLLAPSARRARDIVLVLLFGVWVLIWWEALVAGFGVQFRIGE